MLKQDKNAEMNKQISKKKCYTKENKTKKNVLI